LVLSLVGTATSGNATVASATVTDNKLVITPGATVGTAVVTVNVTDGKLTTTATVTVKVEEAKGEDVKFSEIGASSKIVADGLGNNIVSFLKSELKSELQGAAYSLLINGTEYKFGVSPLNADRYTVEIPTTVTEAAINEAVFTVK